MPELNLAAYQFLFHRSFSLRPCHRLIIFKEELFEFIFSIQADGKPSYKPSADRGLTRERVLSLTGLVSRGLRRKRLHCWKQNARFINFHCNHRQLNFETCNIWERNQEILSNTAIFCKNFATLLIKTICPIKLLFVQQKSRQKLITTQVKILNPL